MQILGAGLAGLIAGCLFPNADILEAKPETTPHRALLRFRSNAVGEALGIEFKKVLVHKGLWSQGAFHQTSIQLANLYARKVIGQTVDRSIWDLDPVERYIAPEDFPEQLRNRCHHRIQYNTPFTADHFKALGQYDTISTIPLNYFAGMDAAMMNAEDSHCAIEAMPTFHHAPVHVHRYRVKDTHVHQTIYFPDLTLSVYRASITGDLMIVESMKSGLEIGEVFKAFGVDPYEVVPIDEGKVSYGKILPIDDRWRKAFLWRLTQQYRIYTLGRYGTWRNLLLDDVLHDIGVIKKMINASWYERAKLQTRT